MKFVILLFLCATLNSVSAKIDPVYANALERGYQVVNDSVIFPDGSKCRVSDFNNRQCGQEWFNVDYCVEEGNPVWDENKCCDGLIPSAPENTDTQKTCVKNKKLKKKKDGPNWFESLLDNTMFWMGLLIPFLLAAYVGISVKRRINKDKKDSDF